MQSNPAKSSYANPEYKAGQFEQYYHKQQKPKLNKDKSESSFMDKEIKKTLEIAQERHHKQVLNQILGTRLNLGSSQSASRKWMLQQKQQKNDIVEKREKENISKIVDAKLYDQIARRDVSAQRQKSNSKKAAAAHSLKPVTNRRIESYNSYKDSGHKERLPAMSQTQSVWNQRKPAEKIKEVLENPYLQDFKLEKACMQNKFNSSNSTVFYQSRDNRSIERPEDRYQTSSLGQQGSLNRNRKMSRDDHVRSSNMTSRKVSELKKLSNLPSISKSNYPPVEQPKPHKFENGHMTIKEQIFSQSGKNRQRVILRGNESKYVRPAKEGKALVNPRVQGDHSSLNCTAASMMHTSLESPQYTIKARKVSLKTLDRDTLSNSKLATAHEPQSRPFDIPKYSNNLHSKHARLEPISSNDQFLFDAPEYGATFDSASNKTSLDAAAGKHRLAQNQLKIEHSVLRDSMTAATRPPYPGRGNQSLDQSRREVDLIQTYGHKQNSKALLSALGQRRS